MKKLRTQEEKEQYAEKCQKFYQRKYGKYFDEVCINDWDEIIICVCKDEHDDEFYGKIAKEIENKYGDGVGYDGGYLDITIQ